jgi:hypothetical protein
MGPLYRIAAQKSFVISKNCHFKNPPRLTKIQPTEQHERQQISYSEVTRVGVDRDGGKSKPRLGIW